ncbi:Copine-domain-containing protein [Ochromonadaceae sp. CCMP2298]|nr:Copine-domain-containing protein [Ochromonadaceae sp. CCMP2298]
MPVDTECFEKITLFLSACELEKIGTFSSSMNAFAVLLEQEAGTTKLVPVGVTNLVKDSVAPQWSTSFSINYHFEAIQHLVVKVFHHESSAPLPSNLNNLGLEKETLIGDARFVLSSLMCASAQKLTVQLQGSKPGKVTIRGEVQHSTRDNFVSSFAANKLSNKEGFFSTSDPFLRASRPLRFEIFDHEKTGRHVFMGLVETSVRAMVASNGTAMDVIEAEKKNKKRNYVNSGTLHATHAYIEENPTFSDVSMYGMYIYSLANVMLSGPTLFGPLINAATNRAAVTGCSQEQPRYNILLILTDGVINDLDASKAAIVAASALPVSIIIIGIGSADFSEMDALDSDKAMLSHRGVSASRDIVQFVAFRDYVALGSGKLAEQVLAEVPGQVLLYMKSKGIKANPAKA